MRFTRFTCLSSTQSNLTVLYKGCVCHIKTFLSKIEKLLLSSGFIPDSKELGERTSPARTTQHSGGYCWQQMRSLRCQVNSTALATKHSTSRHLRSDWRDAPAGIVNSIRRQEKTRIFAVSISWNQAAYTALSCARLMKKIHSVCNLSFQLHCFFLPTGPMICLGSPLLSLAALMSCQCGCILHLETIKTEMLNLRDSDRTTSIRAINIRENTCDCSVWHRMAPFCQNWCRLVIHRCHLF